MISLNTQLIQQDETAEQEICSGRIENELPVSNEKPEVSVTTGIGMTSFNK